MIFLNKKTGDADYSNPRYPFQQLGYLLFRCLLFDCFMQLPQHIVEGRLGKKFASFNNRFVSVFVFNSHIHRHILAALWTAFGAPRPHQETAAPQVQHEQTRGAQDWRDYAPTRERR